MEPKGPPVTTDSTWSWIVAIICGLINFLTFGILRNCGIFYISIIGEFNATREEASLPYSLCYSMINFLGPLAAIVLRYVDATTATLIGGFLAASGMILGYFGTNVYHLALTLGVMQGAGCGLILLSSHVLLNRYFAKNRGSASGICFAGNNIGTLVFGYIIFALHAEFPFKDALLILGGLMLNTVPLSFALRGSPSCSGLKECYHSLTSDRKPLFPKSPKTYEEGYGSVATRKHPISCLTTKAVKERIRSETKKREYEELSDPRTPTIPRRLENKVIDKLLNNAKLEKVENGFSKEENKVESNLKEELLSIRTLLCTPMFLITCFANVVHLWVLVTFLMVCVDVAIDNGMPGDKAAYMPQVVAIVDLICRLGSGWITDKNYLSRKFVYAASLAAMGLSLCIMACWGNGDVTLAMAAIYGLGCGTAMTITFVIFVDYHGLEKLPTAMGISGFLSGLVSLTRPSMIGFFRDITGSYKGLLLLNGCSLVFSAILWAFEPWLLKGTLLEKSEEEEIVELKSKQVH